MKDKVKQPVKTTVSPDSRRKQMMKEDVKKASVFKEKQLLDVLNELAESKGFAYIYLGHKGELITGYLEMPNDMAIAGCEFLKHSIIADTQRITQRALGKK